MFSLFLNPWFMVAGAALVSAPIIIHLINRMRFRRLRWAAMEFLLKSQKRNRRRLIIEQLILLALRCLLILLAGLLVARYITAAADSALTEHLVIVDDSLSQTDFWKEQNLDTAFDAAKLSVKEVAKKQGQASSAQVLKVVLLSDPDNYLFNNRLNAESLRELDQKLDNKELKATALHLPPGKAFDRALAIFNAEPAQGKRVFHFVSDLRKRDWSGSESDQLAKKMESLTGSGVEVRLVDTAHPARAETRQVKAEHDNLALVELRPDSKVVVQDVPVRFTVTLNNFSARDLENVRVVVKARPWLAPKKLENASDPEEGRPGDETERADASFTIHRVPPQRSTHTFQVPFNQTGFLQVGTTLEQREADLPGDNVRYAVIEVRPQVPLLVIDGDYPRPGAGDGPPRGSGTVFLRGVFEAAKGYQLDSGTRDDLANGYHVEKVEGKDVRRNLSDYPCIFLVNVQDLKLDKEELSKRAQANLEKYVREGGGVAFFCGDRVDPAFYNAQLHKKGEGLFPVPLPAQPTRPLDKEEAMTRLIDLQPKLFIRNLAHEMFTPFEKETEIYLGFYFRVLLMRQYWPVPRQQWNKTRDMEELITLPNERPIGAYSQEVQDLLASLPLKEERYAAYVPGLEYHADIIRNGLIPGSGFKQLYELEQAVSALLTDRGVPKEAKRPNLEEFWALPANQGLKARFEDFRERVQYGDPLLVSNRFGKGRVMAWLTTAGDKWNNWPNGEGIGKSYPVLLLSLQKFLSSPEDVVGLKVGEPLTFQLDETRYEPRVRCYYVPEFPAGDLAAQKDMRLKDKGELTGAADKGELRFAFGETKEPGTYCFLLYPKAAGASEKVEPERRAMAFNVDAEAEGDLKRASPEALLLVSGDGESSHGRVFIDNPETIAGRKLARQSDWSQGPWIYLIILAVLVAEQAMAVHLSFHLRGNEAQLPPQAAKSTQLAT